MGKVIDFKVVAMSWFNRSGRKRGALLKTILAQMIKVRGKLLTTSLFCT